MDADGDFVITWQSYGQDGSGNGVYGRRYNAAGVPQGSESGAERVLDADEWHKRKRRLEELGGPPVE